MELQGKIINFLGDSITEGKRVGAERYDLLAAATYGFTANNYGIGGTRLAHQQKPSDSPRHDLCFCGRVYNMDKNADIVVVYGGVNDYLHGDAPFGDLSDKTPATFCGAVDFLMNYLTEEYPNAVIVFLTPARCHFYGTPDTVPSPNSNKGGHGYPLLRYVDTILQKGKEYGIPVLDLYRGLPIDPKNENDRQKYTFDGLHFNGEGYRVLARIFGEFLFSL